MGVRRILTRDTLRERVTWVEQTAGVGPDFVGLHRNGQESDAVIAQILDAIVVPPCIQ